MKKTIFCILIISFIMSAVFLCSQAEVVNMIELKEKNLLNKDEVEVTINNVRVYPEIAENNNTLYIEADFLAECFDNYERTMKESALYGAELETDNGDVRQFLPVFLTFRALRVNYSYNVIYGRDILKIEAAEGYHESSDYTGENPDDNINISGEYSTYGGSPTIHYSTNPVYYTPPGYRDGSYFGDLSAPPEHYTETNKSFGPTFGF